MSDPLQVLGTTIAGQYDVAEFLGQSGSRLSYRGNHRGWAVPVQIECFFARSGADAAATESQRRAFVRAGKDVAALSSRTTSILHARDGGLFPTAFGEIPFVISEIAEGVTVRDAFAAAVADGRTRYASELVFDWFGGVFEALEIAHAAGIVHGHLDGDMMLVVGGSFGPRTTIKIGDVVDAAFRAALPGGGIPVLHNGNGAPELHSADATLVGPWTDVYGLATVMLELMTGETDRPAAIERLPKEQRFAFEKALATRIDERFKTVAAFRDALAEGLASRAAKKQRNPRRTMVVSEQMAKESRGSAGAFEATGDPAAVTPGGRPPKARVRLAFTQPAMTALPEHVEPQVPAQPQAQAGPPQTPTPNVPPPRTPYPTRPASMPPQRSLLPLMLAALVVVAGGGVAVGYLLSSS